MPCRYVVESRTLRCHTTVNNPHPHIKAFGICFHFIFVKFSPLNRHVIVCLLVVDVCCLFSLQEAPHHARYKFIISSAERSRARRFIKQITVLLLSSIYCMMFVPTFDNLFTTNCDSCERISSSRRREARGRLRQVMITINLHTYT